MYLNAGFATLESIALAYAAFAPSGARPGLLVALLPAHASRYIGVLVSCVDWANDASFDRIRYFVADDDGSLRKYPDLFASLHDLSALCSACGLSLSDRNSVVVQVRP